VCHCPDCRCLRGQQPGNDIGGADSLVVIGSVAAAGAPSMASGSLSAEANGPIQPGSVSGSCAAHNLSFRIGYTTVRTSAQTRFDDTSCTALKVGDSVEVKGARQADGSVLASRIQLEDGHD
jgi:hypothetical protein